MLITHEKANQALTKRHNLRLVLKTVYDHEQISRADLARGTNLTATTVSHVISELLAEGLVEEVGSLVTERGKPPTLIALQKDARHVLALNLAQQSFRAGILNLRGDVLQQRSIPAQGLQGEAAVAAVYELVDTLLPVANHSLLGIGVGAPGIIDPMTNVIQRAANLGWHALPLPELLLNRYQLPVHIVNDNQASLLAEHLFGRYKNIGNLVVIRVGRGIGAGLMLNGQLVNCYGAGEIGHVMVVEQGEPCTCGNRGCLETVASRRAIVKRACVLAKAHAMSHLGRLMAANRLIDIQEVIQAWSSGDTYLDIILDEVGRALGSAIANLVGVLGSPQILLCGSVMGFGSPLLERVQCEVQQRTLLGKLSKLSIDFANLETDIIMLGATALLLKNELGLF